LVFKLLLLRNHLLIGHLIRLLLNLERLLDARCLLLTCCI